MSRLHAPSSSFLFRSFLRRSFASSETVDGEVVSGDSASAPSEVISGEFERKGFQAETLKLLDIVTHSLYSDKEVFIRELVSNASDALEKVRQLQATASSELSDENHELEIRVTVDEKNKELIIEDFGVGMTREEMVDNLGTIARSGTQAFMELSEHSAESDQAANIIGRFGVGFYSVFMVADRVTVYSKASHPDSQGFVWQSDGSGSYEIASAENVHRGTKIVIRLKPQCAEFGHASTVKVMIARLSFCRDARAHLFFC